MITKLSRNPNIKSQDHTSRSRRPDGRTRRGHAPKRVANSHSFAAETRQKPRFRGSMDDSGQQLLWKCRDGTLLPSAPINITCSATYRASSVQQRAKVRIFRVFLLSFRLDFHLCKFYFLLVKAERRCCIHGGRDPLVPMVTAGVSCKFSSIV